jgi:hypothetical protein
MLAQSFKSAADLGISEPQLKALMKTLVLLETDRMIHVEARDYVMDGTKFSGHFNMGNWRRAAECGTVACIGGTAELIGRVRFAHYGAANPRLKELFHPSRWPQDDWSKITPAQAATALRSYLTTGDARWDLVVV